MNAPASNARTRIGSATTALATTTLDSPVGTLTIVASRRGVRAVMWLREHGAVVTTAPGDDADVGGEAGPDRNVDDVLAAAVQQLEEYFAGERTEFDVPLDPVGTEFQQAAWMALRTIPYGETVSYGEQARRLGDARKARAVGAANGRNPISIIVPCHRVVGSNGSLTGFGGGIENKAWLLDHERAVRAGGSQRLF